MTSHLSSTASTSGRSDPADNSAGPAVQDVTQSLYPMEAGDLHLAIRTKCHGRRWELFGGGVEGPDCGFGDGVSCNPRARRICDSVASGEAAF